MSVFTSFLVSRGTAWFMVGVACAAVAPAFAAENVPNFAPSAATGWLA